MMRAWFMACVVAASGCASTTRQSAVERLQESVEGYNHAFRWKNYERAAQYLPGDLRSAFLAAYQDDESSLQVEDFQVRRVDMLTDKAATVSVKVSYLLLPSVIVQQAVLVQHWAEVVGGWTLEAEDNSIRKLDATKEPRDPRARKQEPPPVDPKATTEVEVVRPGQPEDVEDDEDEPR
jgi:hypothetical protein